MIEIENNVANNRNCRLVHTWFLEIDPVRDVCMCVYVCVCVCVSAPEAINN